jgi:hypothetical protein
MVMKISIGPEKLTEKKEEPESCSIALQEEPDLGNSPTRPDPVPALFFSRPPHDCPSLGFSADREAVSGKRRGFVFLKGG